MSRINHRSTKIAFVILAGILIGIHIMTGLHWIWYVVLGVIFLGIVAYGSTQIESNYHLYAHCQGETEDKLIALTVNGVYGQLPVK